MVSSHTLFNDATLREDTYHLRDLFSSIVLPFFCYISVSRGFVPRKEKKDTDQCFDVKSWEPPSWTNSSIPPKE